MRSLTLREPSDSRNARHVQAWADTDSLPAPGPPSQIMEMSFPVPNLSVQLHISLTTTQLTPSAVLKRIHSSFSYRQTSETLIRGLLQEPSDLGVHCLQKDKWFYRLTSQIMACELYLTLWYCSFHLVCQTLFDFSYLST